MNDIEDLKKNWKGALAGMALVSAPLQAQSAPPQQQQSQPESQKVDLGSVNKELHPISMLESSGGKNVTHQRHSLGDFHTAIGHLGFKGVTAYETYSKNKHLQTLFPDLQETSKFIEAMKTNSNFYNAVASAHWNHLKTALKTPSRAAFAWRHGLGSAHKATDEQINLDPYVQKYNEISGKLGKALFFAQNLQKSQKPIEKLNLLPPQNIYSYDHLLTPMQISTGYSLRLNDMGSSWKTVLNFNGNPVGELKVDISSHPLLTDKINIGDAFLSGADPVTGHPGHRGLGLGRALYESAYLHAKNKGRFKDAIGGVHSIMASGIHQKLADKHGLNFISHPVAHMDHSLFSTPNGLKYVPITEYDDKYATNAYRQDMHMKSEKMTILSLTEKIHLKLNDKKPIKKRANGDFEGWINSVIEASYA